MQVIQRGTKRSTLMSIHATSTKELGVSSGVNHDQFLYVAFCDREQVDTHQAPTQHSEDHITLVI